MYRTKNDLDEGTRAKSIEVLSARLADSIDLMSQTKQAHWNVKGVHFVALHELFDKVYMNSVEYVDLIAERIVQLGGTAEGTIRAAAKKSTLPEYPLSAIDGADHVNALSTALAAFGKGMRKGIDQTDGFGDKDSADICTEISRAVDKDLWFVEAHAANTK